jgi:hypothetical protein
MKMRVHIAGVLAVGGALALTCCAPLNGADPLDSGELATATMEVVPSSADWDQERRLQDERVQRLSEDRQDGSTTKGSAGIDASADF